MYLQYILSFAVINNYLKASVKQLTILPRWDCRFTAFYGAFSCLLWNIWAYLFAVFSSNRFHWNYPLFINLIDRTDRESVFVYDGDFLQYVICKCNLNHYLIPLMFCWDYYATTHLKISLIFHYFLLRGDFDKKKLPSRMWEQTLKILQ